MKSNKNRFISVDEYIATFPEETQKKLEEVRSIIKVVAPEAREKISYQIGAFELNGKNMIGFAGWKRHVEISIGQTSSTEVDRQDRQISD